MLGNRINISVPLVVSLTAIGIGALVVMLYVFDIAAAVFGPGTGDIEPDAKLTSYVAAHEQNMQEYAGRVDGRSVFYIPPIRPPKRTIVQQPRDDVKDDVEDQAPPPPPPPPPPPATYTGPSPVFAVGSEVWFEKPSRDDPMMRLRVGETAHGIKLVSVSLPATITVEQRGKEFELNLLGKQFPEDMGKDKLDVGLVNEPPDDQQQTPGIVIVSDSGESMQSANQPAISASDLEQPSGDDDSGRPQPTPSDIAFEAIDRPGDTSDLTPDETARTQSPTDGAQPKPSTVGMQEQPTDQWYGPPIPEDLLAQYTNANVPPADAGNGNVEVLTGSMNSQDAAQQPPRDLEAEDENATTDPEAETESQAASGEQSQPTEEPAESTPQPVPPSNDDPIIPPE